MTIAEYESALRHALEAVRATSAGAVPDTIDMERPFDRADAKATVDAHELTLFREIRRHAMERREKILLERAHDFVWQSREAILAERRFNPLRGITLRGIAAGGPSQPLYGIYRGTFYREQYPTLNSQPCESRPFTEALLRNYFARERARAERQEPPERHPVSATLYDYFLGNEVL